MRSRSPRPAAVTAACAAGFVGLSAVLSGCSGTAAHADKPDLGKGKIAVLLPESGVVVPAWLAPADRTAMISARAAALCLRKTPMTTEFPPSPPGTGALGATSTGCDKAAAMSLFDFHA